MKKRLLSLLLALVMILSLGIPAFAAEEEQDTAAVETGIVESPAEPETQETEPAAAEVPETEPETDGAAEESAAPTEEAPAEAPEEPPAEVQEEAAAVETPEEPPVEESAPAPAEDGDSEFWVAPENDNDTITVSPGGTATLKAVAHGDDLTGITYQWYDATWEPIAGATSDSYTVTNVTQGAEYYCEAKDQNGTANSCWFGVVVENHLEVYDYQDGRKENYSVSLYVAPGSTVTLAPTVEADDTEGLTYAWEMGEVEVNYDGYSCAWTAVSDATGATLTTAPVNGWTQYQVTVTDKFGGAATLAYDVHIENNFEAKAAEDWEFEIAPGGSVTLEVEATADAGAIHYQWCDEDGQPIADATSASYTTPELSEVARYSCVVQDDYGNYEHVYFRVSIDNSFEADYADSAVAEEYGRIFVTRGEEATLAVTASAAAGEIHYQWFDNEWEEIPGATGPTYVTDPIEARSFYRCEVSDDYGNSFTLDFDIHLENHFSAQPSEGEEGVWIYVPLNDTVTMGVTATADDTSGIKYQWYREYQTSDGRWESVELEGETGASITSAPINRRNDYYCDVQDGYGNGDTVWFYIAVDNHLRARPANDENRIGVSAGGSTTLQVNVTADNLDGVTYTWYRVLDDDSEKLAETGDTLALTNVTEPSRYECLVEDAYDNSAWVSFTVYFENHFEVNPAGGDAYVFVAPNEKATLAVEATADDMSGVTYQWYAETKTSDGFSDYVEIPGATSATYVTEPITAAREYYCEVQDGYGADDNVWFEVSVENHLSLRPAPSARVGVAPKGTATLQVVVSADDTTGITYQWAKHVKNSDGYWIEQPIQGATGASLQVSAPTDRSEEYIVSVADRYGTRRSLWFNVYTENHFEVSAAAGPRFVDNGKPITMKVNVSADDTSKVTYQWYDDSTDTAISGATRASYTINRVTKSGSYYCEVLDGYGNSETIWFTIGVGSQMLAGGFEREILVPEGGSATLDVGAFVLTGKLTYEWRSVDDDETILAQTATYTVKNVKEAQHYVCVVRDAYDNSAVVYFSVKVDNGFSVENLTSPDGKMIYVEDGGSVDLKVKATAQKGKLTYAWYSESDPIDGATGDSYSVKGIYGRAFFRCTVSDEYGNVGTVYFNVVPQSQVASDNRSVKIESGGKATLKAPGVNATKPLYHWFVYNEETMTWQAISGANAATYTTPALKYCTDYRCDISWTENDRASSRSYYYWVYIENGLTAEPEGGYEQIVPYGSNVTVKVNASAKTGALTYAWFTNGSYVEGTNTLTLNNVTSMQQRECRVRDVYGNTEYVDFFIVPDSGTELAVQGDYIMEEVTLYEEGDYREFVNFYRFDVPAGETFKLTVSATKGDKSNLTYNWWEDVSYAAEMGSRRVPWSGDTLSVPVAEDTLYFRLSVVDQYGYTRWYNFKIVPYEKSDLKGWQKIDGDWVYYQDGKLLRSGWAKDSSGWCWMNVNGRITKDAWIEDGGAKYYLKPNGYMATGWVKYDGVWYFFNASGKMVTNNWAKDTVGWCFLDENGQMVTNVWKKDSKGWCYLGSDGRMAVNKWVKDSVGWCYVGENGYMVTNTWKKDSKGWCYLGSDGRMVIGKWVKDGNKWYYLNTSGYMVTGWYYASDGRYYMNASGAMVTGWQQIGGTWYYFASSGKLVMNGWAKDSKGWCYMGSDGKMVKSQWVENGKYYIDANGYMVTGTQKIGGKTYRFGTDGKLIG